ncbi:deoxynucleotide monophosphate kinase [Pseudomonas sp. NPDC087358]|uniref:deoxynucleotide monophosphate kinase family protein n=1 Tax=Pseudomonas sp. NPDC087358 TaxID=3364439 RepID=UPI00384F7139
MPIMIGLAAKARSGKDTVAAMLLEHPEVAAYALADPLKEGCQALFGLTDWETWSDEAKELMIPDWGMSPRQMFQQAGTDWLRDHNPNHWLMRAERQLNQPPSPTTSPSIYREAFAPDAAIWFATKAFWGLSDSQAWDESERGQVDPFWHLRPIEMLSIIKTHLARDIPTYAEARFRLLQSRPITPPFPKHPDLQGKTVLVIKDIRFENEADYLRSRNGIIWHISRTSAAQVNLHSSEAGISIQPLDTHIDNNDTIVSLRLQVDKGWSRLRL